MPDLPYDAFCESCMKIIVLESAEQHRIIFKVVRGLSSSVTVEGTEVRPKIGIRGSSGTIGVTVQYKIEEELSEYYAKVCSDGFGFSSDTMYARMSLIFQRS